MTCHNVWRLVILLSICSCLLTGCWDRRELEERISFLAIGIDNVAGHPDLYKLTVQIPIPIKIAGSGGSSGGKGGESVRVMSSTGKTIVEAMNNLQKRLNQKIFLGHTRVVALSEAVARAGVLDITDGFRRDPQLRRLLWPVVVKGKAADLLKIQPKLEQIPITYVMDMMESGAKTGMIPDQTLGNFYIQSSNKALEPYLNLFETHDNEVVWKGAAVFKNDKMMGTLPDTLTWVLIQLTENRRGGDIIVPIKGEKNKFLSFHPKVVRTKVVVKNTNQSGHEVTYICKVQGDIIETTYHPNKKDEDNIPVYQKIISDALNERAKTLIDILQKQLKTDSLKLGSVMRAHHYKDYWVSHNWQEDFPKIPITVKYDVRIRRLGMEID